MNNSFIDDGNNQRHQCIDYQHSEMVKKIHYEISYIKSKAFETYQRALPILLVLQGIRQDDIPLDLFCFRSCATFPGKYDESDDDFQKILGILCNVEPVQITGSTTSSSSSSPC